MTSYFNLLKYAATGQASPDMTYYDKLRASTLMGGIVQTLTGIPPLSFKSDGKPMISWSMKGNGQQSGTPSPDNIIMPTFCGVRTANLIDESKVTPNAYISTTGATGSTSASNLSDFIDINGSPFAISGVRTIAIIRYASRALCYFDSDKNYISGVPYDPDVMTRPVIFSRIPSNAKYVRFTFDKAFENGIMLNIGSTALPYEPFGYKIPITCAGQTTPVYLGQVSTVRKIRKLALRGNENWTGGTGSFYADGVTDYLHDAYTAFCSHFPTSPNVSARTDAEENSLCFGKGILNRIFFKWDAFATVGDLITYLASEYAAGHPVTVWYVLANEQTGIVNEPLCKISTYADELHSEDAGVTIPTAKGNNVLTIDGDLQPSEMTITFKG